MNNPVNMVDENGNEAILTTVTGILVLFLGVATILSIPQERYEEAANAVANIATTVSDAYIDALKRVARKTKDNIKNQYWVANRIGPTVKVEKNSPLTFEQAKERIKNHQSVMAKNIIAAEVLAIATAEERGKYTLDKPHNMSSPNYFWHFHPFKKHEGTHIWFYIGPLPAELR